MVREARFAWDNPDEVDLPRLRDTFDDADDALLDHLAPRPSKKRPGKKRPQKQSPPRNEQPARHLAGADWINQPRKVEG
jgi:hypothetical protein